MSPKEEEKYINLVQFSDNEINRRIDSLPAKTESWISLIKKQEHRKRMHEVEKYIKTIEIGFLEKDVISFIKINDVVIRDYKSPLWWSILFLIIAILWIGMHIKFFIKDPYKVYNT